MLRQKAIHRRFIILFLIILLIGVILFPEIQKRPLHYLSQPIVVAVTGIQAGMTWIAGGFTHVWENYIALVTVRRENELLKQEVARLQNDKTQLQEAALANLRLQRLLDLKETASFRSVAAAVIGRDPSNWYRTLMINKGSRDGVEVEMGVVTPVGVVGRVIKTSATASQVLLVTDRNSAVAGMIQRTRDEGLVEGTENGMARIKYLSLLADLQEGDLVLTSGLTGTFPKGLQIGTLGRATKRESDLFQQAALVPSVDFSKLEEVLVITSLNGRPEHPDRSDPTFPGTKGDGK